VKKAPGPKGLPILGSLLPYLKDRLQFLSNLRVSYGDLAQYRLGSRTFMLASHPDDVHAIMQTSSKNYIKATNMGEVFGNGILTSEGDLWRKQRKLIQPLFHPEHLLSMVPIIQEAAQHAVEDLARKGARKIDLEPTMMRLAFEVVGKALFGTDLSRYHAELSPAMESINRILTDRLYAMFQLPPWLPSAQNREFNRAIKTLDHIAYSIIAHKRQTPNPSAKTLVDQLLRARDEETLAGMDDQQIRDEAVTLLLAGHETTAHALSFTLAMLSKSPDSQNRARAEVLAAHPLGAIGSQELERLPFLSACIDETLRLYPPGWGWIRKAVNDDELRGVHIPAGTIMMVSPYITHRHPGVWSEPERFDPDRFLRGEPRHRFAYFPFGLGARSCVGKYFSLMEMKISLSALLARFEFRSAGELRLDPKITLGTREGVPIHLVPR
jgi:cytochrome P450